MTGVPDPSAVNSHDVPGLLHAWIADRTQDLVDDLVTLAELETPSDDLDLLALGLKYIEEWVVERLGNPAARTYHPSTEHGSVLVLDYPGFGAQPIVGLCHYDTVFDAGTLRHWPVRVDGDRITGPGVFDMKGGIVQLVWAVRALDELGIPRAPVRLLFNGDEEIGSPFSRPLLEDASRDSAAVLVFESSVDGAVKTARKGVGLFDVTAQGIESHAGLDPESGASAIDEIARAVTTLHAGADLSHGTSINVGVIRGGTRVNVVAGKASAGVDIRVSTPEEQSRVDQLLASLAARDDRVKLEVSGGWNRPIMLRTDGIDQMYSLARATAAQIGLELREASVGGASDGNFVAALGIPVLDGLGAVGSGAHTRRENVSITGMVERAALAAGLLAALAGGS